MTKLLILAALFALLASGASIADPLHIEAELPVHVVFIGVDPATIGDFAQYVTKEVTPAYINWATYAPVPLPYTFHVKVLTDVASADMVNEVRSVMRRSGVPLTTLSQVGDRIVAPMPLLYSDYVNALVMYGVNPNDVIAIDAAYFLQSLAALTENYIPEAFREYTVYIICGKNLMGRQVAYYLSLVSPDTGVEAYDVGINVYGGGWWSRSVMVDVCSIPPVNAYERYKSQVVIRDTLDTAKDRAQLVGLYVDLAVRFAFAKGNIYRPRFADNILINIYVVDLSGQAITYAQVKELFNGEMALAAFKTLYPYAYFQMHIYLLEEDPRYEELKNKLRRLVVDRGKYVEIDLDEARRLIDESGIIERPEGVFVVPAFILVTSKTAVLKGGAVGIALAELNAQVAGEPWGVLIATAWSTLEDIGLTFVVVHEVGHILGLFHPFNTLQVDQKYMHVIPFLSIETSMTYSASWGPAWSLRDVFYGVYAMRTYYSIFDIDSTDRGIIVDLLNKTRRNVLEVIEMGYGEVLSNKIGEVEFYYNNAIEEFKRHNYFDRLGFRGLGAQLSTSFDHAYMAYIKSRELLNLAKALAEYTPTAKGSGEVLTTTERQSADVQKYAEMVKRAEENARLYMYLAIGLAVLLVLLSIKKR